MNKKGMSVIFQYLLVAIIGGIILFFFMWFAMSSGKSFESLNSAYVAATLKDSFTSLSVSSHSSTRFPEMGWPDEVEFKLGGKENCGRISVDDTNYIPINKVIYGADTLKGKQFNVWTKTWKYPYRITNFFYVNNKNTKYFLVYDSSNKGFVEDLDSFVSAVDPIDHIPRDFNVKALNKNDMDDSFVLSQSRTSDFLKIVFFDTDINVNGLNNVEIVKVEIDGVCEDGHKCKGKVFFGGDERSFYGKAMLYGAIFSGDVENYDCSYEIAKENLEVINDIYYQKATFMKGKISGCDYGLLFSTFQDLDFEDYSSMKFFAETMMNVNRNLEDKCNVF